MKSFDNLFETLGAIDIKGKATKQKVALTKEFKNIMKQIKKFDVESITEHAAIDSLKDNLGIVINRVQDNEIVEYAKDKAEITRRQVYSVLNIPTKDELNTLTKKLASLEKKVRTISKHSK